MINLRNLNVERLYIKILLLFPIFTIFQKGILSGINKGLFALLAFGFFWVFLRDAKIRKKDALTVAGLLFVCLNMIVKLRLPIYNVNEVFYFPFLILYVIKTKENKSFIKNLFLENVTYVNRIIMVWSVIVGASIFFPGSYRSSAGTNYRFFVSFAESTFRLEPSAYFITCLIIMLFVLTKNKKTLFYLAIPFYTFFMGDTRTYFGAGALVILAFWYIYCPKKKYFYMSLIPIILIVIAIYGNSAIAGKVSATQYTSKSYFDYWGTLTNGRSIFWEVDLNAFNKMPFMDRLLGCGINFVYETNKNSLLVRNAIWAHNDFINVLLGFGYIGLLVYVTIIYKMFSILENCPIMIKLLLFLSWFIIATFNMFYTYFCSMLSMPILFVVVNECLMEKQNIQDYIGEKM